MTHFVVIGRTAHASARVRLDDLAGTSGRLDVLLRCLRAALCVSHGIRRDVRVYLVLLGGLRPRAVRIDGRDAKFIRPDERPLATLLLKALAAIEGEAPSFVDVPSRPGIAVACAGLDAVLADLPASATRFLLVAGAPDVRALADADLVGEAAFFVGDHLGFEDGALAALAAAGARPIAVSPRSLHSDDVVTIVANEIDRRRPTAHG